MCLQCEKSGRPCPGPLAPFVYEPEVARAEHVDARSQIHGLAKNGIRWKVVSEPHQGAKSKHRSRRKYNASSDKGNECLCLDSRSSPRATRDNQTSVSVPSPVSLSPADGLAMQLGNTLRMTEGSGHDICAVAEYLTYLPIRIGHAHALDAAVECILLSHQEAILGCKLKQGKRLHHYGKALTALQSAIDDTQHHAAAETLCAALVLCAVEIMTNNNGSQLAWLSHAGGSVALIQAWGPQRTRTNFEKSMLFHHAGQIIGSSLISGKRCFLDSPQWTHALRQSAELLPKWDQLTAKLYAVYAQLPGLMIDMRVAESLEAQRDSLTTRALLLRWELQQMHSDVETLLTNPACVQEVPSADSESPYETCYSISHFAIAQALCMYWRFTIIICLALHRLSRTNHLPDPENLPGMMLEASQHIGRSAESSRRWKPFTSIFQLINLSAAIYVYSRYGRQLLEDSEEAHWLLKVFHEFLEPTATMSRVVHTKYLEAVGMGFPELPRVA